MRPMIAFALALPIYIALDLDFTKPMTLVAVCCLVVMQTVLSVPNAFSKRKE